MRRLLPSLLLILCAGTARASYIETFEDGTDSGGWRLTTDSNRPLFVQPTGGNPGAFLRGQVANAEPAWFIPVGTVSPFLGNYAAENVTELGIDLQFFTSGSNVPHQSLTLDLQSAFGTGQASQVVEAYFVGPDTRTRRSGWFTYDYALPATSQVIPTGWVVVRHDGKAATNADWVRLMQDIETLAFQVGEPGFAYPSLGIWDLGLDNASIVTGSAADVPEPASVWLCLLGVLGGICLVDVKRRAGFTETRDAHIRSTSPALRNTRTRS